MYSLPFPEAIHDLRTHSIIFLALSPLSPKGSFNLHVLAMPPAFNLSQDQTLQLNIVAESIPEYQSKRIKRSRSDYPGRACKQGVPGRSSSMISHQCLRRQVSGLLHSKFFLYNKL